MPTNKARNSIVDEYIWNTSVVDKYISKASVTAREIPLSVASEAFDSIKNYGVSSIQPQRLGMALLELNECGDCIDWLKRIEERRSSSNESQLSIDLFHETYLFIGSYFRLNVPILAKNNEWMSSSIRDTLSSIIEISKTQDIFIDKKIPNPMESGDLAMELFENKDFDLFSKLIEGVNKSKVVNILSRSQDIFLPAKSGYFKLQSSLLESINNEYKILSPTMRSSLTLRFWSGVGDHVSLIRDHGDSNDVKVLLSMCGKFNQNNVLNLKQMIKQKKLFPMLNGIFKIGSLARDYGIKLKPSDYKILLGPLDKMYTFTSKEWMQAVKPEELKEIIDNAKNIFNGVRPENISKTGISKGIAHSLSDLLDDNSWLAQVNILDRGDILSQELGI